MTCTSFDRISCALFNTPVRGLLISQGPVDAAQAIEWITSAAHTVFDGSAEADNPRVNEATWETRFVGMLNAAHHVHVETQVNVAGRLPTTGEADPYRRGIVDVVVHLRAPNLHHRILVELKRVNSGSGVLEIARTQVQEYCTWYEAQDVSAGVRVVALLVINFPRDGGALQIFQVDHP